MSCKAVGGRTKHFVVGLMFSSALMLIFQLPVRAGQSVTLTWNPGAAADVAGYKIYSGTASHIYSNVLPVGNTTNATLAGLVAGTTYYFAATTLDGAGNESSFSNETSYTVPVTAATLAAAVTGGQFSFTVAGFSGQQYVVQASTDLLNWLPVQTNTAPFLFTDSNVTGFNQRFYRALYLGP